MSSIQVFDFESNQVRVAVIDNTPYFVAKDVTVVLGYKNSNDAIAKHVDEEDRKVLTSRNATLENIPNRGLLAINDSGVYALIFGSKLPNAKKFKRWVTSEVLPSIQKHGAYMTPDTIEAALLNPDTIIKLATNLKEEQERRKMAEQAVIEANNIIEAQKPKVLFAESVAASETSILVRELAKLLQQNGIEMGERRLFAWLRENGYLIKPKYASDYNLPTQKSMRLGLFEIKETPINRTNGIKVERTPKVTGKGQVYFLNKLRGVEA